MDFTDLVLKNGNVYSRKGNRVFGLVFFICPRCKRFVKKLKFTKEKTEWLHCLRCKSQLLAPHIEFDRKFMSKKELYSWVKIQIEKGAFSRK